MSDIKPIFPPSKAQPLDELFDQMRGQIDLDTTNKMMVEMDPKNQLRSNKSVAKTLYALAQAKEGRELLEWLCDLTVRRVDMSPALNIEQAAMAHERMKERFGLMMMITQAIDDGQKIAESEKETT